jgi:hypothetical protein
LTFGLTGNTRQELLAHGDGSDEQFAVGLLAGIPGEGIKQVGDIGTQIWITGKIAQVCIDATRDGL